MDRSDMITDDILHAFVDGHLSEKDSAFVETWLNENPDRAEEIADWMAQNADIKEIFPQSEYEMREPQADTANVNAAPKPVLTQIAAALVLLVIGASGGWILRGESTPASHTVITASLVQEAITAHAVYAADPQRPVEIAASEEALLIRWLSNRVGQQMVAPNLENKGFDLVGGRLLAVSEGPAAQFMYENAAGTRITLMAVRGDNGRMAEFRFENNGETNSFYWQDQNLRYALVGDIARDDLSALATDVFDQLTAG